VTKTCSGRQVEAAGPPLEPGAAHHLALAPLQPMAVPCARPRAPGPRHPGLDGGIIRPEPSGEAPEGGEQTGGRAGQPRVQGAGLPAADEAGDVLGERHRCRHRGRLRSPRRQLLVLVRHQPRRRTTGQPGGPTRGELVSAVQRDTAIRAPNALAAERPAARPARATPTVPASPAGGDAGPAHPRQGSGPPLGWRRSAGEAGGARRRGDTPPGGGRWCSATEGPAGLEPPARLKYRCC
jgi:hypothetical protein